MKWFWKKEENSSDTATNEAINSKVYWNLEKILTHHNGLSVWLSKDYSPERWEPVFASTQGKINEIREWAQQLPFGKVKDEYLSWLRNYYESGLSDARQELYNQDTRRSHERRDREYADKKRIMETLNIPEPPRGAKP